MDYLYHEQKELEIQAVENGVARYRMGLHKGPKMRTPEMRYIQQGMEGLEPGIKALQGALLDGKKMPGADLWGPPILSLPAEHLGIVTLMTMWELRGAYTTFQVAFRLSSRVHQEIQFYRLRKEHRDLYDMYRSFWGRDWNPHRVSVAVKKLPEVAEKWNYQRRLWVGSILMEQAMTHTDLFFWHNSYKGNCKTHRVIMVDPEVEKAVQSAHEDAAILRPHYLPMVVQPRPYEGWDDGGYLLHNIPLVKVDTQDSSRGPEDPVGLNRRALNALAETPWEVSKLVYDTAVAAYATGYGLGKLPPAEDERYPEKPASMTPEQEKAYWISYYHVDERRNQTAVKRRVFQDQLWIARMMAKYPRCWFPWQLDWRGRAYPVPSTVHPQSNDFGRAVMHFSRPNRLGETGFKWLTIHLANSIGWDKDVYADRIAKVREHEQDIRSWVRDPLANKGWAEADDPWKTLAAASEWVQAADMDDPGAFLSRLPIALDGTCNGLQHLSALGRDEVGGAAVNLVPMDRPGDLYTAVAAIVQRTVNIEATQGNPLAKRWQYRISRKLVKRPAMTTAYNVSHHGLLMQTLGERDLWALDPNLEQAGDWASGAEKYQLAKYIRNHVKEAISGVVVKGVEIMRWLIDCSTELSKAEAHSYWVTPAGFAVKQAYAKPKVRRVITSLQQFVYMDYAASTKLDTRKQIQAIAPNFVHSLDAAHMSQVICRLHDEGVRDYGFVHDSYAVPACWVDTMTQIIREEFVALHSQDLLRDWKEQQEKRTGVRLPEPPSYGTLDIQGVLRSEYFFM